MVSPASKDASPMGGAKVKKAMLLKSIKALSELVSKRSANANQLFDANSETMTVLFTLSQIPEKGQMKPKLLPLPHPLFDDKSEVCYICADPQKEYKELLLRTHPVPGLTKVLGMDKLKRNFKTAEEKRALADSYDLFLCDRRVVEMMPKVLGSIFYQKKKKAPLPVKLVKSDPVPALKKAMSSTPFRIPAGPCVGVRFGRCSMDLEQLAENAAAVIGHVLRLCASNPVQSISVQATDAPALPVWRRANTPGAPLDLKKYRSDNSSSAASDTEVISGASQTEGSDLESLPSDAGETLSARDTLSELEEPSMSELGSDAISDVDDSSQAESQEMPLLRGIKKGLKNKAKRKANEALKAASPRAAAMPPPSAKKMKKGKA